MQSSQLVLASASPHRRELLERLALDFTVEPAEIDESVEPGESALDYVTRLARQKAQALARPGVVVIGADTAVVLDTEILGKPTDDADARRMLRRLSGRSHEVITGLSVVVTEDDDGRRTVAGAEVSHVHVDKSADTWADWYVETGEPYDKAGGYALQGAAALFADRVEGSVTNVIGLPLPLLDQLFAELGLELLAFRGEPQ